MNKLPTDEGRIMIENERFVGGIASRWLEWFMEDVVWQ